MISKMKISLKMFFYPYFDPKTSSNKIEFVKGMKFASCEELKHAVVSYAIANG